MCSTTIDVLNDNHIHTAFVAVTSRLVAHGRIFHAKMLSKGNLNLRVRGMMLRVGEAIHVGHHARSFRSKNMAGN